MTTKLNMSSLVDHLIDHRWHRRHVGHPLTSGHVIASELQFDCRSALTDRVDCVRMGQTHSRVAVDLDYLVSDVEQGVGRTVRCYSKYEQRHTIELRTASDRKAESFWSANQFNGITIGRNYSQMKSVTC